jgi:transposase
MNHILSLDLGRFNQKTHGGRCLRHGGLTGRFTCPTNVEGLSNVFAEAKKAGVETVVFEAQPAAFRVADLVVSHGMKPLIANTHAEGFKFRAGQSKSDKLDVGRLSSMTFRGEITGITIPSERDRGQRSLVSARAALVEQMTMVKNRIRGLGEQYWLVIPAGNSCWSADGLAQLKTLSENASTPETVQFILHSLLIQIEFTQQQITAFDVELKKRRKSDAKAQQLLKELPGFGPCTTDAYMATVGDPSITKKSPRSAGAFVGLNPTQRQSGKTLIPGPISRAGNHDLRGYLVEAAHQAIIHYPEWKALYLRFTKGKTDVISKHKAIVAIARRLAVTAAALLKSGKTYDPERIMPKSTWPDTQAA